MNILQLPNAVFLVGLVVQCWIRHHFIQRTKSEKKTVRQFDRLEKILLAAMFPPVLLLPLLYLFTSLLSFADYPLASFIRWAGAVVMVASLWLFWRSHVDLGQNWSVSLELRENHQLVSHGVYRWVRHPMYASIWLWGLAQGMMLANWFAGWSVIPVFATMYYIRMPREERLMYEEFGDGYREYARRTGRVFPRLTKAAEPAHAPEPAVVNLRKAIMTATLAAHLSSEMPHVGHEHKRQPSHFSHVHAPEEPTSSAPTNAAAVAGARPTGRTVEIRTGQAPISNTEPDCGMLLAILQGYRSGDFEDARRVWADGTAVASGSAGHFRLKDEGGNVVFQGNITELGGGGELTFDNNIIVAGGTVILNLAEPGAAPDGGGQ
jgi:protein-S-isoprenylcysteine O-methyltransferase Ste14